MPNEALELTAGIRGFIEYDAPQFPRGRLST
jgi:hypothetical protein